MSELVKKSGLWVLANVMYKTDFIITNKRKLVFEFAGNMKK
jgi:hypothetical protein